MRVLEEGAGWASNEEGSIMVSAGETARDGEEAIAVEGRGWSFAHGTK